MDLGPQIQLDIDVLGRHQIAEGIEARQQEAEGVVPAARMDMRCQHQFANTVGPGQPDQAQGRLQVLGAIIDRRQIMAMDVNHPFCTRVSASTPTGHKALCPGKPLQESAALAPWLSYQCV